MDPWQCGANCNVSPDDCDTMPYLGLCTIDIFNQSQEDLTEGLVGGLLRVHKHDQGDYLHLLDTEGKVMLTLCGFYPGQGALISALLGTWGLVEKGQVVQDEVGITFTTYELSL
jgi:hypothetical protein